MRLRYAMIFVSDLERSLRFYRDLVGLPVLEEERDLVDFDLDGSVFAIHQAHVDARERHHPPMLGGTCRLGFTVEALGAVHARLVAAGTPCLNQPEARADMRVALYEDPDGVQFTLAEPLRR
jgi:lactoylglutathione lyase